jgi:hypothetical protein
MTSSNRCLTSWENFWNISTGAAGEIFWDADPAHVAQQDVALFQEHAPYEKIGEANLYMLSVLRQLYAEGVASTFSNGSRDGDTHSKPCAGVQHPLSPIQRNMVT